MQRKRAAPTEPASDGARATLPAALYVGCCVEARWRSSQQWFSATVQGVNRKDTYAVEFDDGTSLPAVKRQDCRGHVEVHDYVCSACDKGGDLLCCDECTSSFHVKCAGLASVPDGYWRCPACEAGSTRAPRPPQKMQKLGVKGKVGVGVVTTPLSTSVGGAGGTASTVNQHSTYDIEDGTSLSSAKRHDMFGLVEVHERANADQEEGQ